MVWDYFLLKLVLELRQWNGEGYEFEVNRRNIVFVEGPLLSKLWHDRTLKSTKAKARPDGSPCISQQKAVADLTGNPKG